MIDDKDRWALRPKEFLLDEEDGEHWYQASLWAESIADGFLYQGQERLAAKFYQLSDKFIP